MNNGLVGSKGQAGIKQLSKGVKMSSQIYQYEVKVFHELANYRLYGNYNKDLRVIVFTKFGKSIH